MKIIKLKETSDGLRVNFSAANDQLMPGKYQNKRVYEIIDVPDNVTLDELIQRLSHTTVITSRSILAYSELGHSRIIKK